MRGLSLCLLLACETMDAPGSPFDQVAVVSDTPVSASGSTLSDPTLDEPEPSGSVEPTDDIEETALVDDVSTNEISDHGQASLDEVSGDRESAPSESLCSDDGLVLEDLELLSACDPSEDRVLDLSGSLRLERTFDGRKEGPTAVVVLDNGDRVYAKVGTMFPTLGVVVMGIGDQRMQMAQIRPSIDGSEATMIIQYLSSEK